VTPASATLAPTEAEIRAVIDPEFTDTGRLNAAGRLSDAFNGLGHPLDDLYDVDEFRASERDALDAAAFDAIERIRARAIVEVREAIVTAALRFAVEYPDAPRAREGKA
jgi:hypothetical protein